ncbi:MAG: hypothetical protein ACYCOR_15090 [Acidobacteriaceae bacterium]
MKIVGGFALFGFFLPLVMLAYYALSRTMAGEGLVRICPTCMLMLALDQASISAAFIGWLMICASNAVIYALPGIAIAFLLNLRKSN